MEEQHEKIIVGAVKNEQLREKLFAELGINEEDLESLLCDVDKTRANQSVV